MASINKVILKYIDKGSTWFLLQVTNGTIFYISSVSMDVTEYIFKENYYFMSGENMENSEDSRYWEPLTDSYIVGKATLIGESIDKRSSDIRWNRIFKRIK